jgi:hypothetical protein
MATQIFLVIFPFRYYQGWPAAVTPAAALPMTGPQQGAGLISLIIELRKYGNKIPGEREIFPQDDGMGGVVLPGDTASRFAGRRRTGFVCPCRPDACGLVVIRGKFH